MKYFYYVLFLILFLLLTTIFVFAKEDDFILASKVIIIDPGHGGKDVGTSYQKTLEKDINLAISLKLKELLNKKGAVVLMTRDDDYDLSYPNASRRKKSDFDNRIYYINNSNSDLYLSIHINYLSDHNYSGAQVFYLNDNESLARAIQDKFNTNLNAGRDAKVMSKSYYMYRQLKIPGVLIECGFLSNAKERKLLLDEKYQEKLANSIIEGIVDYYKNN